MVVYTYRTIASPEPTWTSWGAQEVPSLDCVNFDSINMSGVNFNDK
jgi:hypothetical protein